MLLVSLVTVLALASSYEALQTINPVAAVTAITVAAIGIVWFKKTR